MGRPFAGGGTSVKVLSTTSTSCFDAVNGELTELHALEDNGVNPSSKSKGNMNCRWTSISVAMESAGPSSADVKRGGSRTNGESTAISSRGWKSTNLLAAETAKPLASSDGT
jgi:hypothetical protein